MLVIPDIVSLINGRKIQIAMAARSLLRGVRPMVNSTSSVRRLNFDLTEDSLALQELARKFAREEMMPKAAEYDKTMEYPQDVFTAAWELGLGKTVYVKT